MRPRNRRLLILLGSIFALFGSSCVIRIGTGDGEPEPWISSGDGGAGTSGSGAGMGATGTGGSTSSGGESDQALLDQVEPQELAFASAKATVSTCALAGTIDALPLDPAGIDDTTLLALMEQYAPAAADQTDLWLQSVDPLASAPPPIFKPECIDPGGCAWQPKCEYGYNPGVGHRCIVNDCGPAKCSWCPSWVPELLKGLAFKSWCSYVCVRTGVSSPPVVAVGAGAISLFGGHFVGPVCMPP